MSLRLLVRAPLLFLGGIIMAVALNARLTVILLVAIPILLLLLAAVAGRAFPLFTKAQQSLDRVNAVMQENLAGVRVVKAYVCLLYTSALAYLSPTTVTVAILGEPIGACLWDYVIFGAVPGLSLIHIY